MPLAKKDIPFVWARLPRAGLGNKLFVWARAYAFSALNQLPLSVSGWDHLQIGPLLRRERSLRRYGQSFRPSPRVSLFQRLKLLTGLPQIHEPGLISLSHADEHAAYVFSEIPHWRDMFGTLHPFRDLIRQSFYDMLSPHLHAELTSAPKPLIAVHVRQGDFRPLKPGEDFARVGSVRTPLDYFVDLITGIRRVCNRVIPVTIFSDGRPADLAPLLALESTELAQTYPDVLDLVLMSSSRLLICSAGSTFSYWAAFFADAPILLHPDHIHAPIRPADVNQHFFEGGVDGMAPDIWPELLKNNISNAFFAAETDHYN
jgi:hypothetical protein